MFGLLFIAAALPSLIAGVEVISCGGGLPAPTGLRITGCVDLPCHVFQGDMMTYHIDFVPTAASSGMTLAISSTAFGNTREVELSAALRNACNNLSPGCPVAAGQEVTQSATIPVSSEYHDGIPVQLRVTMTNAENVINMCTLINLVIH